MQSCHCAGGVSYAIGCVVQGRLFFSLGGRFACLLRLRMRSQQRFAIYQPNPSGAQKWGANGEIPICVR